MKAPLALHPPPNINSLRKWKALEEPLTFLQARHVNTEKIRQILHDMDPVELLGYQHSIAFLNWLKSNLESEKQKRKRLMHYLKEITVPPLPPNLEKGLTRDCLKAIKQIDFALQQLTKVQNELDPDGKKFTTRFTRRLGKGKKDILQLLREAGLSHHLAAQKTLEILKIWIPERAPKNENSLRVLSHQLTPRPLQ